MQFDLWKFQNVFSLKPFVSFKKLFSLNAVVIHTHKYIKMTLPDGYVFFPRKHISFFSIGVFKKRMLLFFTEWYLSML